MPEATVLREIFDKSIGGRECSFSFREDGHTVA